MNVTGEGTEDGYSNITLMTTAPPNNTISLTKDSRIDIPMVVLGVFFAFRSIWSVLAVMGNGLTILAIAKFHSLQTNTNLLVSSLAVADFIQGLITPFTISEHLLSKFNHVSFVPVCMVSQTIALCAAKGNIFFILWISIDRYLNIAYPLKYAIWITSRKMSTLVVVTWIYCLVDTTLLMYFTMVLKPGGTCRLSLIIDPRYYTYYLSTQLFVCLMLTIFFYILIGKIAVKQGKAIASLTQPYNAIEAAVMQQQKKIAKIMFMVLASFILCYLPQFCLSIAIQNRNTLTTIVLQLITNTIFYSNSFLNPLIYAWKSKEFRIAFKKILGFTIVNTPVHPSNTPM